MKKSPTRFIRRVDNKFTSASLDLNFQNMTPSSFDSRITFTRASNATYFDGSGILQTASTNVPRLDHSPTTRLPLGLLIEEQRTNLLYQSGFATIGTVATTNAWYETAGTLDTTVNATTSPDGTTSGALLSVNSTTSFNAVVQRTGIATTGTYTYSVFCKANSTDTNCRLLLAGETGVTNNIRVDFVLSGNGTAGSAIATGTAVSATTPSIQSVGNGWYRCTLSATLTSPTNITVIIYPGTAGAQTTASQTFVWGAQLEAGAFPTSYIPTTTAAATRNADVATMTGTNFSSWYNQSEGTLYSEAVGVNNISSATRRYAEIGDNTINERLVIGYNSTTSTRFLVIDGGSPVADITVLSGVPAGSLVKIAGAYKVNDFQQASNSTLGTADTSGALPTATQMTIGSDYINVANTTINGHIRRIAYWGVRLDNSKLQALTT